MSFSFDKFLRPITATDRNIKIYEDNGILKYTINPFHIKNTNVLNNTMRINLDSDRSIVMVFSTNNEAKISLKLLQDQMDVLTEKVPFIIDKDVLNYVTANIKIGPTGSNGKIFTGTSSTYLTIPNSGYLVQLTTQKDLAFVPGQTIVVYKDFPTNYYVADYLDEPYYDYSDPVYMVGDVDTYNPVTGNLAFVANVCQPVGATSSIWYINLTGQKGKDGTSGTSGASAYQTWLDVGGRNPLAFSEQDFLDDIKGEKGAQGFEGIAGVNGTDGTSGTSGTSGASAYQTWLSVGGRNPLAFSEQDFLDDIKGAQGAQGFEGMQGPQGPAGSTIGMSYSIYRALLTQTGQLTGTASSAFGGALILGEVYTIVNYENGDDFSNMFTLSGTANETGSTFVATEPLPLNWGAESLLTSGGGIVANVLENNLGFDITWDWTPLGGTGYYFASNGGAYDLIIGETTTTFPREKTTYSCSTKYAFGQDGGMPIIPIISHLSINDIDNGLVLEMYDLVDTGAMVDNALYYNLVEIKIYQ